MSSRIGRTAVVHFGTQILTTLSGFVATWYINWRLGPGVFGEYSTALALLFWLNVPASAIGNAMTKRISEQRDPGAFLSAGFVATILLHVAIVAVLLAFSDLINVYVGTDVALLFVVLVATRAVFDSTLYALRGNKQVDRSGVIKAGEQTIRSAIHVGALFFLGVGVAGLVAGYAVAAAVTAAAGIAVLRARPTVPERRHFRALFEFAKYAWLGILKNKAFAWADVAMMRALSLSVVGLAAVSKAQIGIYSVSWTVASTLALFSISINKTLFPEISSLGIENDYERIHGLLTEGLTFTGLLLVPGLFGAILVGDTLLTVFGPQYAAGGPVLVILIAARLFAAYGDYLTNAISAIDRPDVAFRTNFAYVVANLSLNVVLITQLGWYGAALATALSALFNVAIAGYALSRLVGRPRLSFAELGRQILASAFMAAVVFAGKQAVPDTLAWTVLIVALGAVVYGLLIVAISERVRTKVHSLAPV